MNAEDPNMTMKALTDRAAQTLFWTELARGFAVTLAHIFKVGFRKIYFNEFLEQLQMVKFPTLRV